MTKEYIEQLRMVINDPELRWFQSLGFTKLIYKLISISLAPLVFRKAEDLNFE